MVDYRQGRCRIPFSTQDSEFVASHVVSETVVLKVGVFQVSKKCIVPGISSGFDDLCSKVGLDFILLDDSTNSFTYEGRVYLSIPQRPSIFAFADLGASTQGMPKDDMPFLKQKASLNLD